jgi:ubiquinone/menaquinone biosynthesis C-methylase UbiE
MGFYSQVIFPRICDRLMGLPALAGLRKVALADVGGDILEVGFGTGLNLVHYPKHVRRITTVDPNPGMNRLASKRIAASGIQVDQRMLAGESMPFDEGTFDCVVSTWTMCSIAEVERALGEVFRVLRPGGRLVFLEHGLSGDPKVRDWQRRLNPIERVLANGCRLDQDVEAVVRGKPFSQVQLERFEMDGLPKTHGTMYRGSAVK